MNEKELLLKLKYKLEKKADEVVNYIQVEWGLWNLTEMDLIFCIADIFKEEGWMCFFEVHPFDTRKSYEKTECDLVVVNQNKEYIWIECKLVYFHDRRLYKKDFEAKNWFLYDIEKLKAIKDAKEKYYMIFTNSHFKDLNKLPTKRSTDKIYTIQEALHLCGFKEDSGIEIIDTYYKDRYEHFHTLQIVKVE